MSRKKEISWDNEEYLQKVRLQDLGTRSQVWMLEGKASVGPCFHDANERPSGITICVPKVNRQQKNKSLGDVKEDFSAIPSVININTKKSVPSKSNFYTNYIERVENNKANEIKNVEMMGDIPKLRVLALMKLKIESIKLKIRNTWNI